MVNVFASSKSPIKSARALPDLLTGRMCLETAQVLCGAVLNLAYGLKPSPTTHPKYLKINGSKILYPPYKRSLGQRKHPVILWAGQDRKHFVWVLRHLKALNAEYRLRYGRNNNYKSYDICYRYLKSAINLFPEQVDYEIEFKAAITQIDLLQPHWSVHKKYRYALVHKYYYLYAREPTWKNCDPPDFLFDPKILSYFRKLLGKPIRKLRKSG